HARRPARRPRAEPRARVAHGRPAWRTPGQWPRRRRRRSGRGGGGRRWCAALALRMPDAAAEIHRAEGFDLRRWRQPHGQCRGWRRLRGDPGTAYPRPYRLRAHGAGRPGQPRGRSAGAPRRAPAGCARGGAGMSFAPVPELLEEIRNGRMVVIVDDEDRENEGDLIMAAELVRPSDINFMVTHARGLVCLSLTRERCRQL